VPRTLSNAILLSIRGPMTNGEQELIQRQFRRIQGQNQELTIHLLDADGVIKRSTPPPRWTKRRSAGPEEGAGRRGGLGWSPTGAGLQVFSS